MVIWVIGLSGSGKTFLAKEIFKKLRGKKIIVDGDTVRKYITYDLNYSKSDRKKNSQLISDLCRFLELQGFIVVCSILSIFRQHQKNNRSKFDQYFQIFIDAEISKLIKRNNKNVYSKKNVVGAKIKFPSPYKNDMVIKNNYLPYSQKKIQSIINKINNAKKNKEANKNP